MKDKIMNSTNEKRGNVSELDDLLCCAECVNCKQAGVMWEQPYPTELGRDIDKAVDVMERNMMRWQPIETAPKDGTSVLVFLPGSKYVRNQITSGYWSDHQQCRCWIAGGYMQKDDPPTHWMPYPDGPNGCA